MSTIDRILEASRPTDADIEAEFTPATQARILDEIISGEVVPLAPRHSRRWVGLVAAGVAVAVGGLTVQALLPSRTTTVVTPDPSGGASTVTVTQPPIGVPVAVALEPIAQAAAKRPDLMPVGRTYFHMVAVGTQTGISPGTTTSEVFVAADGWTWAKTIEKGRPDFWMLFDSTIENYRTLPSDPKKLDATLRARQGSNSGDERVYKGINEILASQSAPPTIKAAAIRVLDNLSKNPQAPEKRNGLLATPRVTLTATTVRGHPAVLATLTDATSRPDVSFSMALDSTTGDILESGSSSPTLTSSGTYVVRELVDTLPAEFVSVLGTARVHKEIWR